MATVIEPVLGTTPLVPFHRDAVHMAIISLTAKVKLYPGQHVDASGGLDGKKVAVVDPFKLYPVQQGEVFWAMLYPRTVSNIRHDWSHDEFPD